MKFFLQDDDTTKEVDHIIKQLQTYMDGDISQQMGQHGLNYQLNYGSSMVWIKQLAEPYINNQKIAERLWLREVRETMLMATIIADAKLFDKAMLEQWISIVKNNEVAEQLGANLLSRIDAVEDLLNDWSNSSNVFKKAAFWVALSIKIRNNESLKVDSLMQQLEENLAIDSTFLQRTKGRFLRALCRTSKDNMTKVETFLNRISENISLAFLAQELQTEIDFLKDKD